MCYSKTNKCFRADKHIRSSTASRRAPELVCSKETCPTAEENGSSGSWELRRLGKIWTRRYTWFINGWLFVCA